MSKIDSLKAKTVEKLIKDLIDPKAVLQSDESTTFSIFEDFIDIHMKEISSLNEGKFNLKWAHTAISNLKSSFKNTKWYLKKSFRITLTSIDINSTEDLLKTSLRV